MCLPVRQAVLGKSEDLPKTRRVSGIGQHDRTDGQSECVILILRLPYSRAGLSAGDAALAEQARPSQFQEEGQKQPSFTKVSKYAYPEELGLAIILTNKQSVIRMRY